MADSKPPLAHKIIMNSRPIDLHYTNVAETIQRAIEEQKAEAAAKEKKRQARREKRVQGETPTAEPEPAEKNVLKLRRIAR